MITHGDYKNINDVLKLSFSLATIVNFNQVELN